MIFKGIRTSIAKKPYIFVIFQGGLDPLSTPLDPRMVWLFTDSYILALIKIFLIPYNDRDLSNVHLVQDSDALKQTG